MTLIIEDGSIVDGADSYATAAELVTYAAKLGRTIPADEAAQEALLLRAIVVMEAMNWLGTVSQLDQPLAWPRYNVVYRGYLIPSDEIPTKIKQGQMALACDIYDDEQSDPETARGALTRRKLGEMEQEFAERPLSERKRVEDKHASRNVFSGLLVSSSQLSVMRA